jgi:hypothetical protein
MKASLHSCKKVLLSEDLNLMIRNRCRKGPANGPKKTGPEPPAVKYHVGHLWAPNLSSNGSFDQTLNSTCVLADGVSDNSCNSAHYKEFGRPCSRSDSSISDAENYSPKTKTCFQLNLINGLKSVWKYVLLSNFGSKVLTEIPGPKKSSTEILIPMNSLVQELKRVYCLTK